MAFGRKAASFRVSKAEDSKETTMKPTKSDCSGCENNFYNGNNPYGVEECWSFKTATMVSARDVPVDMRPPYKHLKETTRPSCYKAKRMVRVKKEALNSEGYWKS